MTRTKRFAAVTASSVLLVLLALAGLGLSFPQQLIAIVYRYFSDCGRQYNYPMSYSARLVKTIPLPDTCPRLRVWMKCDTVVCKGLHGDGHKNPSGITDWLDVLIPRKEGGRHYHNLELSLIRYASSALAKTDYAYWKSHLSRYYGSANVFAFDTNGSSGCHTNWKEAQADPEGLCAPMGYYFADIVCTKANMMVRLRETANDRLSSELDSVLRMIPSILSVN